MFGADSALVDIVNYISINARSVHYLVSVPASFLSSDVLQAGQQGCDQVILGECRLGFP